MNNDDSKVLEAIMEIVKGAKSDAGVAKATMIHFHLEQSKTAPDAVIALAHTLLFGSTPAEGDILKARERIGEIPQVWLFPLLRQSKATKSIFNQGDLPRDSFYAAVASDVLRQNGGIVGLADKSKDFAYAMGAAISAASRAGKTIDEEDLLYIGTPDGPATDAGTESTSSIESVKLNDKVTAHMVEINVDDEGNYTIPEGIPEDVRQSIKSKIDELVASGRL